MGESGAARSRAALPLALRVLLVIGFAIAVGATALVVFADDAHLLRLAAVLALWAALIAAFAVTRSRRDARAAAMREGEAQLAYQLELHREVAARREYEADLSQQVAAAQSDQIGELREQLERLTGVLASLVDGEVTVSRLTLSAESARFRPGQAVQAEHRSAVAGREDVIRPMAALAGANTVEADPAPVDAGETDAGQRPDAPAAAWARRHADRAEAVEAASHARVSAGVALPAGAGGRPDEHDVTRPLPVVPGPRSAAEPSPAAARRDVDAGAPRDGDGAAPAQSPMDRSGDDDQAATETEAAEGHPGDHESGVSVADLLAAYGLSGRSRRRHRD